MAATLLSLAACLDMTGPEPTYYNCGSILVDYGPGSKTGWQVPYAWSPDSTQIAFSDERGINVVSINGEMKQEHLVSESGVDLAWSADGEHLAFTLPQQGHATPVYAYSFQTGAIETVSNRGENPSWSPDSQRLAFHQYSDQEPLLGPMPRSRLWLVDLTRLDKPPEPLPGHEYDLRLVGWSPAGDRLAYTVMSVEGEKLYVMDLTEQVHVQLTQAQGCERWAAWSPDGQSIAYSSNRNGTWDIYVAEVDSGAERPVASDPAVDEILASWSVDGQQIVYVQFKRTSDTVIQQELYVVNAAGTDHKALTATSELETAPKWSPDGQKIAFLTTDNIGWYLEVMNPDGTERKTIKRVR